MCNHTACREIRRRNGKGVGCMLIEPSDGQLYLCVGCELFGQYESCFNIAAGKTDESDCVKSQDGISRMCFYKALQREVFEEFKIAIGMDPEKLSRDQFYFPQVFKRDGGAGTTRYFMHKRTPIFVGYIQINSNKIKGAMKNAIQNNPSKFHREMSDFEKISISTRKTPSGNIIKLSQFVDELLERVNTDPSLLH